MIKNFNIMESRPFEDLDSHTSSDGKRFYKRPDGTWVPSVTTILSHKKNEVLEDWKKRVGSSEATKISNIAKNKGSALHQTCEDYLLNSTRFPFIYEKQLDELMPDTKSMFMKVKRNLDQYVDNVRYVEAPVYSKKYRMAGRIDLVADYDGVLSIIDFKTSLVKKKETWIVNYFEQESAYAEMYKELTGVPIDRIVTIVSCLYEEDVQIFYHPATVYLNQFLEKVNEYPYDEHGRSKDIPNT